MAVIDSTLNQVKLIVMGKMALSMMSTLISQVNVVEKISSPSSLW